MTAFSPASFDAPYTLSGYAAIRLDVRRSLRAVEHIVRREVNEQRADATALFGEEPRQRDVETIASIDLRLRGVHRGVTGRIHDDRRFHTTHELAYDVRLLEIRIASRWRRDGADPCQRAYDLVSDLARTAEHEHRGAFDHTPQESTRGRRSRGIAASGGAASSFGDRIGAATGHGIPSAGSFHRIACSAAGE